MRHVRIATGRTYASRGESQSQIHFHSTRALWFGQRLFMVRVGSNSPAELRQGRPVREDRSGPGNNKSIYESKTGETETGSSALFFKGQHPAARCILRAQLHNSDHYEDSAVLSSQRWRVRKCLNCYDGHAHNRSVPSASSFHIN